MSSLKKGPVESGRDELAGAPAPRRTTSSRSLRIAGVIVALTGSLLGRNALAERCDGPPRPSDFEVTAAVESGQQASDAGTALRARPRWKRWRFCVIVTKDGAGNWTLSGDRKTREIDIPPGHKADIVFLMDRDYYPDAWLSALSLEKKGGGRSPRREFVTEDDRDFADDRKFEFRRPRQRFRINVRNQVAGYFDYEIWIRTRDSEADIMVDPRIRNRGRLN